MKAVKWTCACALLAFSPALFASTADGVTISHFEPMERMSFHRNGVAVQQKLQNAQPVTLSFDAMGRSFELELETNNSLLLGASRTMLTDDVGVYRGRIASNPDSWTRIVVADGIPRGLIWDGRELFAVEAPDDGILNSSGPIVYRLADVNIAPGAMSCGATAFPANGNAMYETIVREFATVQNALGATEEIKIGAIGDFEFTNGIGGNAAAEIATRLNNVDGIFSQQLGVQLTVETIETFSDPADPFSDVTNSSDFLDEVAAYRVATPAQNQQGLTHLFTGRNLDGSTVGVAFVGALCSTQFGAGLSEGVRGPTVDSLIAAHEIGHNFGADHDGDPDGSCPAEGSTFLMAPSVSIANDTFSPCSLGVMQAEAASASCITPLPSIDMTVGTTGQPTSVLLGNAANLTFDVTNNGTLNATGVSAEITLPGNVSFVAAAASQGSCTSGASNVNCTLGTVGGSSGSTVTVTAATNAVGPATFAATVSSDADDNPGNNQTTLQLSIDPAVNLVVSTPSSSQVSLNQSTTVTATLQNSSSLTATDVEVTIALDAGIRADTATWTAGNCTVAAQQVDCAAATLASQANSTLSIGVTGVTAGTQGYTVTVGADEADTNPADNSRSGSVNVTSGSAGDDEGGGAVGIAILWMLGLAAAVRRGRRT